MSKCKTHHSIHALRHTLNGLKCTDCGITFNMSGVTAVLFRTMKKEITDLREFNFQLCAILNNLGYAQCDTCRRFVNVGQPPSSIMPYKHHLTNAGYFTCNGFWGVNQCTDCLPTWWMQQAAELWTPEQWEAVETDLAMWTARFFDATWKHSLKQLRQTLSHRITPAMISKIHQ